MTNANRDQSAEVREQRKELKAGPPTFNAEVRDREERAKRKR
jgi:hypothetical protein